MRTVKQKIFDDPLKPLAMVAGMAAIALTLWLIAVSDMQHRVPGPGASHEAERGPLDDGGAGAASVMLSGAATLSGIVINP